MVASLVMGQSREVVIANMCSNLLMATIHSQEKGFQTPPTIINLDHAIELD
jgi:hypothetical protein